MQFIPNVVNSAGIAFVGAERRVEVERLHRRFVEVAETGRPAMVVYVAQPGWGKTRIIQEFYRVLAAGQAEPAFWPASLVADCGSSEGFSELTASRKAVRHRELYLPANAQIPWLWLAPASGRLSDGSPAPALSSLVGQLVRCLPALLSRRDQVGLLDDEVLALLAGAVPMSDVAELALLLGDVGQRLLQTAFTEQRRLADGATGGLAGRDPQPARVSALLDALVAPSDGLDGVPAVLVLDDAHDLDAVSVEFLAEIFAVDLPVLVLATTWPDRILAGTSTSPFAQYLAESGHGAGFTQVVLGRLADEDLIEYLSGQFPATDPQILAGLVRRADGNPYSLRLLLNTPRVLAATRGARIDLTVGEIAELNGGLDRLLGEHWAQLSMGVRQVLVTASMLGVSFHEEILEECLRQITPSAGLEQALASAWIQHVGGRRGLIEFIEYMRYQVARGDEPNVLSPQQRRKVQTGALDAIKAMLADADPATNRTALLALHVALAEAGVEEDLPAAARSAFAMAERARWESRRQDAVRYLRLATKWLDSVDSADWRLLAESYRELSNALRMEYNAAESVPSATKAVELADANGDVDYQVRTRCTLAYSLRQRHDPAAYEACGTLVAEAGRLAEEATSLSAVTRRVLLSIEAAKLGSDGQHAEACERNELRITFCEEHFGLAHQYTLAALEDTAYHALRAGNLDRAIELRRTLLDRRLRIGPEYGQLQTAGARNNLAFTLLEKEDDDVFDEVDVLVSDAITLWSRAFGLNGRRTGPGRLVRARLNQRRGLKCECAGDHDEAQRYFHLASAESGEVLALRADRVPSSRAIALLRHGVSLACLRQLDGLTLIGEALSVRRGQLRQDDTFWEFRRVVRALCWAYERFGRKAEADSVRGRYRLDLP